MVPCVSTCKMHLCLNLLLSLHINAMQYSDPLRQYFLLYYEQRESENVTISLLFLHPAVLQQACIRCANILQFPASSYLANCEPISHCTTHNTQCVTDYHPPTKKMKLIKNTNKKKTFTALHCTFDL